ncbi:MAG: STAS domain-containing protein [Mycobacterium sp.]
MALIGTSRLYRPDPARAGLDERWGRATAKATMSTDPVVVSVRGEIDASNGVALASYVERHAGIATTLILDLSAVEFFGTAGLTALRRIDLCCDRIGWMLVPSPAVRRALRACRAEDLPQTESVASAAWALDRYHVAARRALLDERPSDVVAVGSP